MSDLTKTLQQLADGTMMDQSRAYNAVEVIEAYQRACRRLLGDVERQAVIDAKRFDDSAKLQEIGKSAYESIAEMVAALECDYDRLEELRADRDTAQEDSESALIAFLAENEEELKELEEAAGECTSREDADQRIQEDPLSVEMRGDWYGYGTEPADAAKPVEFTILLGTGGPATRIMGELDDHGQPTRAWIQAQDWFQPWTDYIGGDSETLLTYCRCFYFGEG